MSGESFEKPETADSSKKTEKKKVLIVETNLAGPGLSPKELSKVLEKSKNLHDEDKIKIVAETSETAPLDLSGMGKEISQEKRPKHPQHRKRKGEKY